MRKIFCILLILIFVSGCDIPFTGMFSGEGDLIELTETDIITMLRNGEPFTANDLSIMDVKFGDSESKVKKKLGAPDIRNTDYQMDEIINLEYNSAIGLEETGLLIHLEDDEVTRMTVLKPFNDNLVGLTKIGKPKGEMYAYLGAPDRIDRMIKGPKVEFKTLIYPNGFEVLIKKGETDRLSFVKQSSD